MDTIRPYTFSQPIQGVQVKPLTEDGKQVRIRYNGLLKNSGSPKVIIHCGFGEANQWRMVEDIPMEATADGWEKTITMQDNQINFCFRDGADHWDNNNGLNWIYRIS